MNRNAVIALCVAAFLAGDAEGVIRSNLRAKRLIKKLQHENDVAQLKIGVMNEGFFKIANGARPMEVAHNFSEKAAFIDIIEKSF